MVLKRSKFTSF